MSGRVVSSHRQHKTAARVALAALCALACGALVGLDPLSCRAADEPIKKSTVENPQKKDGKPALVADHPFGRPTPAKFRIPNADLAIWQQIKDFEPEVGSEITNPNEYELWCGTVLHAKQFAAADLEGHAARDVSVMELRMPHRVLLRTELLRFDGRLMYIRRLEAPLYFKENSQLGVTELYEARIIPVDESPRMPISVVFTELPPSLAAVKEKPVKEWLLFDSKDGKYDGPKVYVSAAGFFFKTLTMAGDQANALTGIPVLIGKGVTTLSGPPVAPGADPTAIDPLPRLYSFVKDETELVRNTPTEEELPEVIAYNRVLIHAHRFTAQQLEERARDEVTFADLFEPSRKTYRWKLVKFEGRLISLRKSPTNAELREAGVEQIYEGWLVPEKEPRGNPVCIHFTEPPAGVDPVGKVNKWVTFAGYSFKKRKYESQEEDPANPKTNLFKYAPMLIGKSPIGRPDPSDHGPVTSAQFVLWAIVGGAVLIASAGLLTWYYRGGDRRAKAATDAVRNRNPFGADATATGAGTSDEDAAGANPPPVRPSNEW